MTNQTGLEPFKGVELASDETGVLIKQQHPNHTVQIKIPWYAWDDFKALVDDIGREFQ